MAAITTLNLATEEDNDQQDLLNQYLVFSIGNDKYGIAIRDVFDINPISHITRVPRLPHYMKGIINMRGTIVPVMDVRMRFNREEVEYNNRTSIIVMLINNMYIGLIVDTVLEVIKLSEDDIVPPPASANNQYIMGIGKVGDTNRLLVDCASLLDDLLSDDLMESN